MKIGSSCRQALRQRKPRSFPILSAPSHGQSRQRASKSRLVPPAATEDSGRPASPRRCVHSIPRTQELVCAEHSTTQVLGSVGVVVSMPPNYCVFCTAHLVSTDTEQCSPLRVVEPHRCHVLINYPGSPGRPLIWDLGSGIWPQARGKVAATHYSAVPTRSVTVAWDQ